ncbi:hypothetical protein D3C80_1753740 [compost metagenome]
MQASGQPQQRGLHVAYVGGGHENTHSGGKCPRHANTDQNKARARDITGEQHDQKRCQQPACHAYRWTPDNAQRRELENQQ